LSRRLMVTNGNVTGMVDRLVGEGLVERQPAPNDRRAQLVKLTPAGKTAFAEMIPKHQALVEAQFANLSRADLRGLHALLGELKDSIKKPLTAADRREKN
jgi:DNA-binding MarR family transcriptional regulator